VNYPPPAQAGFPAIIDPASNDIPGWRRRSARSIAAATIPGISAVVIPFELFLPYKHSWGAIRLSHRFFLKNPIISRNSGRIAPGENFSLTGWITEDEQSAQ
jgi:hypothetical protein